jgi:hypothetical protein
MRLKKVVLLGNGQCPKSLLISQSIWYLQRKLKYREHAHEVIRMDSLSSYSKKEY